MKAGPNEFPGTIQVDESGIDPGQLIPTAESAIDEIKKTADQLQRIIDGIPTLAWRCRLDGSTEFLNQRWLEYTGLTLEQALGWGWTEVIHPEDSKRLMETWVAVLASEQPGECEARMRRSDGEYRWFLFRAVPLRDELGNIIKWYGTNTDIEDRKRAESLLAAENRVLEMVAAGAGLNDILDSLCRTIDAHAPGTMASVLLMDAEGKRLWPAAGPRVPNGWTQAITPLEIGPRVGSCGAAAYLKKPVIVQDVTSDPLFGEYQDGLYRDLALSYGLRAAWSQPLISKNTEVVGTFAMYFAEPRSPSESDLELIKRAGQIALIAIERKQTESALQESEERFRHMADTIPEVIWITSLEPEKVLYVSPSFERIWGLPVEDLYENPRLWMETIHPEDRERVVAMFSRWIAGDPVDYHDVEFRITQPGGAIRWIHERGVMSRDEEGKPYRVSGISTDVTERKQAEQRLTTQHAVTQMLAEATTLDEVTPKILKTVCDLLLWDLGALWSIDREAGVLRCVEIWHKSSIEAPQFEAITRESTFAAGIGLPGRVWSSRKPAYIPDVVHDANFLRASVAAREGLHAAFAFPILLGADVLGVIDFFSHEIRHPDQELLNMMAALGSQIGQFIERKRAEEELRRSEAYLAEAQRLSLTGSFGWKVSSGELFWSKETFCIIGCDPGTKPTLALVLDRVHPEDLAFVQQTVERASRDATDLDFEHRLLLPDGAVKHIHVMAHAVRDESAILEYVGAVSDVTATRFAEEKIRQSESELRRIVDLIPQVVIVADPDGAPLYANRVMLDYTGLRPADVPSVGFGGRLSHPEDVEKFRALRRESLTHDVPFELEQRMLGKDGVFRWFLFRYNPLKDDSGKVARWYVTATDIHDRRQAEERIQKENLALREEIDHSSMFEEIVGSSAALRKVLAQVEKVAPVDSTVLILGETGTGKELIARAIHKRSHRSERAFIRVNCAAIPTSLIGSELFGHEKGAFTGALQRRLGRFELADGGTIFLDEIGDLPAETQLALLRVLQERELERVGGSQTISVDVRVLAATNRDLKAAVAIGAFRQDLFYRLNVFPIQIPLLRQRVDDIPLLVEYFIERYAKKAGKKIRNIRKRSLELFQAYDWPGNIRELQNVIERGVILCESETFSVDETWLKRETQKPGPALPFTATLVENEKEMIEAALAACQGRIAGPLGAAAKLGIPRQTLESKIKSLRIDKHRFKSR
jgi:PAS domain S-box-containing protein